MNINLMMIWMTAVQTLWWYKRLFICQTCTIVQSCIKWLLICSQTCTWIANNADCTNKTHIAGAAVMMPLFLQTPTSSPLSSSLLWSIGYSEIVGSKMGEFFEGVSSPSCWIEYQSLSCDQLDWNVVINIITIFLILFISDDDYKGRAGWGKLWSRVHEVESRTRTLWADKRLREPDQRESQTKSEWAKMCESEPQRANCISALENVSMQ